MHFQDLATYIYECTFNTVNARRDGCLQVNRVREKCLQEKGEGCKVKPVTKGIIVVEVAQSQRGAQATKVQV